MIKDTISELTVIKVLETDQRGTGRHLLPRQSPLLPLRHRPYKRAVRAVESRAKQARI